MPEDRAGAEENAPELEVAEARKLSQALAQLRQAAEPTIRGETAAGDASLPPAEDLADAKAWEEDSLSSWVASTRASAVADAKAWEEDALKSWVNSARAASIPGAKPAEEPRKKAPRQRKEPANKRTSARGTRAKAAIADSSGKAARRVKPLAPAAIQTADASEAAATPNLGVEGNTITLGRGTNGEILPLTLSTTKEGGFLGMAKGDRLFAAHGLTKGTSGAQRDLLRLRRAIAWHWLDLVQRAAPAERARWLGQALMALARAGGSNLLRTAGGASRLLRRASSAAARAPLRFISELDVAGLIALLLALLGVVTVIALLMRG